MIRYCHCGRPLAAHAAGERCEKPRVKVSMEARCASGSTTNGHNPDIREDTVRQARDTLCDASSTYGRKS
jgi:hypothetical protein